MKIRNSSLIIFCILCATISVRAQGTFQNLGFESATLVPVSTIMVQFAPAFPSWSGYVGGVQQSSAAYNRVALDSSAISIIDHGWSNPFGGVGGVIDGSFTAVLQAGVVGSITNVADTTLSQTAVVPSSAQSLQFKAYLAGSPLSALEVTLGGQQLSLTALGSGANYTLYGAAIPAWAGQTAELDFTVLAGNPHISNNYVFLDDIQFSNSSIPEPSTLGLSALGALLLGWRVLRCRRG